MSSAFFGAFSASLQEVDWVYVGRLAASLLPIWLCGAVVGFLIPRPKWMSRAAIVSSYSPYFRQLIITLHLGMIAREIWKYCINMSVVASPTSSMKGKRDVQVHPVELNDQEEQQQKQLASASCIQDNEAFYVKRSDWEYFRDAVEREVVEPGTGSWEVICDKSTEQLEYIAYRRTLPNGLTQYKSTTTSYDATAQEFMDFFLNDPLRPHWDNLITSTEVVEHGDFGNREQVVRWVRSFPFAFLTDREYVLARRVFADSDALYGISKAIEHPDVPTSDIIRVNDYRSMWRSRTIPSPRGGGEMACETVLLHCESMKIPERLARFAVRHGMWGFVKKMGPCTRTFLKERRSRADSYENDPQAFGYEAVAGAQTVFSEQQQRSPLSSTVCSACSSSSNLLSIAEQRSQEMPPRRSFSHNHLHDRGLKRRWTGLHSPRHSNARRLGALVAFGVAMAMGPMRKCQSHPHIVNDDEQDKNIED